MPFGNCDFSLPYKTWGVHGTSLSHPWGHKGLCQAFGLSRRTEVGRRMGELGQWGVVFLWVCRTFHH